MATRDYAGRIYFLLSFLAFAGVTVLSSQPPLLRDYPDWVYQGVLFAKTLSGHPVAGYALKHYPVPNSITTVAIALLTLAFGWLWAAKLWMLIYLIVAAATIFVVSHIFALPSWLWWALPTLLFFGQSFWYATISFNLGVCALLLLLCLLRCQREGAALIVTLLVICFFLHLIVYAAAGLLILLYCLEHRRWKPTYIGLATLPLPLWYFLGRRATPSNETALGYSPSSHLAVPAVIAVAFLACVVWHRGPAVTRWTCRLLVSAAFFLSAITVATLPLPNMRFAAGLASPLFLVRLKTLIPFQLFGFVNIIYEPMAVPLFSATLALLHRPLFLLFMLLDVLCGVTFLIAFVRVLLSHRSHTDALAHRSRSIFIDNFLILFSVLYLVCPPNALGVIGIDLRLAQLAFAVSLVTLTKGFSPTLSKGLAWLSAPLVLLFVCSLYQFAVSQQRVTITGADITFLPPQIAAFGAVDPTAIADEYDRLRTGKLEGFIFATGLFYQTQYWPHGTGVGR